MKRKYIEHKKLKKKQLFIVGIFSEKMLLPQCTIGGTAQLF